MTNAQLARVALATVTMDIEEEEESDEVVPLKPVWNNMDGQWRQRPGLPPCHEHGAWPRGPRSEREGGSGRGGKHDTYPRMSALSLWSYSR